MHLSMSHLRATAAEFVPSTAGSPPGQVDESLSNQFQTLNTEEIAPGAPMEPQREAVSQSRHAVPRTMPHNGQYNNEWAHAFSPYATEHASVPQFMPGGMQHFSQPPALNDQQVVGSPMMQHSSGVEQNYFVNPAMFQQTMFYNPHQTPGQYQHEQNQQEYAPTWCGSMLASSASPGEHSDGTSLTCCKRTFGTRSSLELHRKMARSHQQPPQGSSGPEGYAGTAPQNAGYLWRVRYLVKHEELRDVMLQFGPVVYFDINRQKKCAFVEFAHHTDYLAALAASPFQFGSELITMEPRGARQQRFKGEQGQFRQVENKDNQAESRENKAGHSVTSGNKQNRPKRNKGKGKVDATSASKDNEPHDDDAMVPYPANQAVDEHPGHHVASLQYTSPGASMQGDGGAALNQNNHTGDLHTERVVGLEDPFSPTSGQLKSKAGGRAVVPAVPYRLAMPQNPPKTQSEYYTTKETESQW